MSLRELYQEMIVDHGKNPRNFGELPQANCCQIGHNPLCGDKITVYLQEKDGVIAEARFSGNGCAISVASASLMTEIVKGKTVIEITQLFTNFHQLVTTGVTPAMELGKLTVFSGVAEFPIRVKCATLAWHTMQAALQRDVKAVSTE
jgi:nitrogen fixation NifU-like protein